MKIIRIGCMAAFLMIPAFKSGGASLPSPVAGHGSGLTARVVSADGATQTVRLEGAGCTQGICSRVFLRGQADDGTTLQPLFGSIASIKDTTDHDALFVMRNGSELRLKLVPDFRVLYLINANGVREKLDLSKIRSLEFLGSRN